MALPPVAWISLDPFPLVSHNPYFSIWSRRTVASIRSAEPSLPGRPARRPLVARAEGEGVLGAAATTQYEKVVEILTTMFPVWVILGAAVGLVRPQASCGTGARGKWRAPRENAMAATRRIGGRAATPPRSHPQHPPPTPPQTLAWFSSDLFTVALGFLMLSMGLTLTFDDFKQCAANPAPILVGYLAQYCIKPLAGYVIASAMGLHPALATGLILVSCCPGGQASNVATFIAHGNVALSVIMTTASTMGAIVMTPLLTKILAGAIVSVDAAGLALSTLQVVLVPTVLGVLLNEFAPKVVAVFKPALPLIGVCLTAFLCGAPVAQIADILKAQGLPLLLPVALLHAVAFALGYWLPKALKFDEKTSRTVSIETGMQSAALGFLLAQKHFADPLVAVPSAVSVVFMAVGGSALAVFWRGQQIAEGV